jgi:hypothetical protein
LSGTDYFDAEDLDEGRGYYFFAGTQGRVVGRNIFLGGNSFRTSPRVSKKNLVGDAQAGFSVLWSKSLRLDISVALCTEEFHGQRTPDGGAQLYLVASARAGASAQDQTCDSPPPPLDTAACLRGTGSG